MQTRLLRIAAKEFGMSIRQVVVLFEQNGIFKFIEECYDEFHTEGDYAVFCDIKKVLEHKGVNVNEITV
jgi:hypothetical protein